MMLTLSITHCPVSWALAHIPHDSALIAFHPLTFLLHKGFCFSCLPHGATDQLTFGYVPTL